MARMAAKSPRVVDQRRSSVPRILTLIMAGLLAVAVARPGPRGGKERGQEQAPGSRSSETRAMSCCTPRWLAAAEITIIYDYVRRYGVPVLRAAPRVAAGMAKNLARGKACPPGIAKRYVPRALLAQLPPRPGYEWLTVDRDILLVVAATEIVVGILKKTCCRRRRRPNRPPRPRPAPPPRSRSSAP